jgi:hypothetical protein
MAAIGDKAIRKNRSSFLKSPPRRFRKRVKGSAALSPAKVESHDVARASNWYKAKIAQQGD